MKEIFIYNRAFFLRFKKIERSDSYVEKYLLPSMSLVLDQSMIDAIAVEEDEQGCDCMVLFLDDLKIMGFMEFCQEESLILEYFDISTELLKNEEIPSVVTKMIKSDEFSSLFDSFFKKNLTIDIILDKIGAQGAESLTIIEKEILGHVI